MPATLIINGTTVINGNTDVFGRIATFSTSLSVGTTVINTSSIAVQTANITNLIVGSISTSGAGGSSSGFAITGNGSFTGALSAGSISTGGTFSAGNSTFNGTITLGSIFIQNGQYNVGSSYLNGSNLFVPGTVYAAGVAFGGNVGQGIYTDATNIAVRATSTNGGVYLQNGTGSTTWASFLPGGGLINQSLQLNGSLTINGGQIQTDYQGNGGVRIINGGAGQTGYLEFRTANTAANRAGYFGFAPTAGGAININAESGYYFNFTGAGGIPQIGGSNIISQSTLNSALTNYITSSQLSGYATTSQLGNYLPLSGGTINGLVTVTGNPFTIQAGSPALDLLYPGVIRARWQVDGSANMIYRNGDNGGNYFYISTNGAVWTAQIGDLNSRIEQRASDYANSVGNARQTGNRWVYAGDLGNDWNIQSGFQTPYNGAAIVDRRTGFGNSSDQLVQGHRWRYLQLYIPNQGWINSYYAS